jgi:hypothetical protein
MALWCAGAPPAAAAIVLNEVLADPAEDANGDGSVHATQDEFIELANTGPSDVSLAQWRLADGVQVRHVFADSAVVPGYGFLIVFGGGTPQGFANAVTASSGGLGLNNGGDSVTLLDPSLAAVDAFSYGGEGNQNASLTRVPDGDGAFALHSDVSPWASSAGRTISGAPQLPAPLAPQPEPPPPAPDPSPAPPPPAPDPIINPPPSPDEGVPPSGEGPAPAVPEPASWLLFGAGLCGARALRRRRGGGV